MKRTLHYLAMTAMAVAATVFTACNADTEFAEPIDYANNEDITRSSNDNVTINNTGSAGVLVLQEGNMTSENGFLNFIPGGNNQFYRTMVSGNRIANVCQDLAIYGDKIYIIAQNTATGSSGSGVLTVKSATNFTTTATYVSEISAANNPTHVAAYNANTLYVRGSGVKYDGTGSGHGIYCLNPNSGSFTRLEDGGKTAAATPMVIADGYLYVCYNDGVRVYNAANHAYVGMASDIATAAQCVVKSTDGSNVYVYSSKKIYEITPATSATEAVLVGSTGAAISTWSNSAQLSYYDNALYYATSSGVAHRFNLATASDTNLGSIFTGADQNTIGSIMYNGVAVDPDTGYLYVASSVYGNTNGLNFSTCCALQVFDASGSTLQRIQTFAGDDRFTAGIFFPANFYCTVTVGSGQYATKTPEKYDPNVFYE